jgi:transposase
MNIIAIDLGKFNSMVCFFDSESKEHRTQLAKTERGYLKTVLQSEPCELVVMEACSASGWVHDLCQELGLKTLVCSTHEDAWRWRNVKRKTDKDDALKLARLAYCQELKPTHVPSLPMREYRGLIHHRKKLVGRENQIKNSIRSLFANRGIAISRGKQTWFTGREVLEQYRKPLIDCAIDELWKGELDQYLSELDQVSGLLKQVEKKLDAIASEDERVQRVMQIDGVGRVTAEAIVTAIDDAKRFESARQVSAYAGLTPRQYQSGETDRRGRITKRGPRLLRTLLVECAWVSLRYNEWARTTYERIHGGKRVRRKKAAVALARKILVVAWAMLRDETDYDPSKLLPESATPA